MCIVAAIIIWLHILYKAGLRPQPNCGSAKRGSPRHTRTQSARRAVARRLVTAALNNLFFIGVLAASVTNSVYASGSYNYSAEVASSTSADEQKSLTDRLNEAWTPEAKSLFGGYNPNTALDVRLQQESDNKTDWMGSVIRNIIKYAAGEVFKNVKLLAGFTIFVLLCALLKNLQTSFNSKAIGEAGFFMCYAASVTLLLNAFTSAVHMSTKSISDITTFMYTAAPAMMSFTAAQGGIASALALYPVLAIALNIGAGVINSVCIPLVFFSAVISIVDNISEKVNLNGLSRFLRQFSLWTMGVRMTVLAAIAAISGTMGAAVDTVTGKTVKFAVSAVVPVVGKCLADATDTVLGSALLIKNTAGVAIMLAIIAISIIPLIKILAMIIIFKLTGIICAPLADNRMTNCLSQVVSSLAGILGAAFSVACLFLVFTAIIINSVKTI
jgi:stage III sporulation protein AE